MIATLITQDVQPDEVIVTVYTANKVIGSKNEPINTLSTNASSVLSFIINNRSCSLNKKVYYNNMYPMSRTLNKKGFNLKSPLLRGFKKKG